MVGDERPRGSPAIERLHHRCFHFDEIARLQLAPQRRDDARPRDEHLAHFRVGDQVQVALAVAGFHVLQAVPLFGHRKQRLGKELQLLGVDAQLAGAGPEQVALHADDVADIQHLEELEIALADRIFLHVNLQPLAVLLEVREARLAHVANSHHASGHTHAHFGCEFLGGLGAVCAQDLGNGVGEIVAPAVGAVAQRLDFANARQALLE